MYCEQTKMIKGEILYSIEERKEKHIERFDYFSSVESSSRMISYPRLVTPDSIGGMDDDGCV